MDALQVHWWPVGSPQFLSLHVPETRKYITGISGIGFLGDRYKWCFALCYGTVVHCLSVCLSLCHVGALWPNGWMAQDATSYGGRPWPRRHCARWGPSSPTERGTAAYVYCVQTITHVGNCWARFAGWMLFLSPDKQCWSSEEKAYHQTQTTEN